MYAASEARGLREGGPAPRRPRRDGAGAGEAGGGARRRRRRRRDRARRGPARGRGPGLLRPRRPDPRPARLGRRPRRGGRHRRAGRGLPAPALRRASDRRHDPAEILVPALPPGRRRPSSSCSATCAAAGSQIRVPQRGDKKTLQETVARNAGAGAGAAQDQAGQRPDHPQPGAGGDPAGARARRRAAAHRVLRRLQPPGHRGGRLDGGLRGRPGPQERVPPLRHQGRRRPERRRLDARGDHPAVPPAARRAGQVASST